MGLIFSRKESKNKTTFSSMNQSRIEKYLYGFKTSVRNKWLKVCSVAQNHYAYDQVRVLTINLVFTSLVVSFVCWSFMVRHPLRIGVGIAVTLAMLQYYLKWYFSMKK